ncbi:unnamed protein product [Didymodactylos carnosus]|uniref:Uncharacterized protein n=1 Tax=Didymodactylos carnosus TaxID=1234261 RepID=A0A813XN39_9BILA|nr:unnamed protein product [Didymodactylos carnosus]CAF0878653.1 unnamed protein product [Didymodactylos carnosus]CAF1439762.1 unnamed protein product [Didymodactylos carnosus]CAF3665150.1 unnamed protein product [Didymodactylos carnosus]CAF3665194.1 unnamed protein product [Didymodactylos carnosus]
MVELSCQMRRPISWNFNDICYASSISSSDNFDRLNTDLTLNNLFGYTKQTPMTYKDLRMFITNKFPSNTMILPSYSVKKRRPSSRTSNNSTLLKDNDDLRQLDNMKNLNERKKSNEVYHKILSRRPNSSLLCSDTRYLVVSSSAQNDDLVNHQFYNFYSSPIKKPVNNIYTPIIITAKPSSKINIRQTQSPLLSPELKLPRITDDTNAPLKIKYSKRPCSRDNVQLLYSPTSNEAPTLRLKTPQNYSREQSSKEKKQSNSTFDLSHPKTSVGIDENKRIKIICESTQITSSQLPDGRKIKLLDVYMPKISF